MTTDDEEKLAAAAGLIETAAVTARALLEEEREEQRSRGVWAHAWGNGGRWLVIAAAVFAFALGALITVALVTYLHSDQTPFDPVRSPSPQKVLTQVVHNGQSVVNTGVKCNATKEPVTVRGSTAWVTVTPSGFRYSPAVGAGTIYPGCHATTFAHTMPPEVVAENAKLFALGERQVQWRFEGSQTPVKTDGTLGVTRTYSSDGFTVIP